MTESLDARIARLRTTAPKTRKKEAPIRYLNIQLTDVEMMTLVERAQVAGVGVAVFASEFVRKGLA